MPTGSRHSKGLGPGLRKDSEGRERRLTGLRAKSLAEQILTPVSPLVKYRIGRPEESMSDIEKALARAVIKSMVEDAGEEEPTVRPPEIEARRILDFYNDLNTTQRFKPGDLVTWKRGLKNGKFPHRNYPAIVSYVYDEPVLREDMESGSNHFREPLDLVILVDTGSEVSEFHVDSRRFCLYSGPIDGQEEGA